MDSGYKRPKQFMIRVEEDARDKAVTLSQRYDLSMKDVLSKLIDLCDDYNLLKPGWDISKILIEDDATKKAVALSQRYGLPMKAIISTLIDLCVDYDLLKPGWDKRLNAAMDKGEIKIRRDELAKLENKCAGLFFADEWHKCIQGREDKTPMIKKLAKDRSEAVEACKGCDKTKFILKENLELKKHVTNLESKMENGRTREEHTYCKDGGWYDDKTGRINCKKMDVWQDQDRCFTMWNGKPCPSLKTLPARRVKRTGIRRRKR